MSAISGQIQTHIYFEEKLRQEIDAQETEMRSQIKEREEEVRYEKHLNIRNRRIVEEIRPICEEVPNAACDPVTYEPLTTGVVTPCLHSFNLETVNSLAEAIEMEQFLKTGVPCPVCRHPFAPGYCYISVSVRDMAKIFQKISAIFKKE